MYITASKLYDYIKCEHRVWRDAHGPKDEISRESNPFLQLLWENGLNHEKEVVSKIGEYVEIPENISESEQVEATLKAMDERKPLIYHGVLIWGNLKGVPDLLQLTPNEKYIPIDIKSGMGYETYEEGDDEDEGKPKKHYAVQLALYAEILNELGYGSGHNGLIIDGHSNRVEYNLDNPVTKTSKISLWQYYEQIRDIVGGLIKNTIQNKPALAPSTCKLCPWYLSCKKWSKDNDDLTELFSLGRSKRDIINRDLGIKKSSDLMGIEIDRVLDQKKDKNFLKGIAEKTLQKIINRAFIMHKIKKPVLYSPISLPNVSYELFFDIEDDPTREFVYMHGVYERNGDSKRYLDFTAQQFSRASEEESWKNFWIYIKSLPKNDFAVYFYSAHEKIIYRRLQKQYPDVISSEDLENFFLNPNVIDLYNSIILKYTDWPVGSYSIKELATYLNFKWRDETPSGALSIQWYNEYLEKRDESILKRILQYNEDDCRATMVLKDALQKMNDNFAIPLRELEIAKVK